jgi:hypothetical protein
LNGCCLSGTRLVGDHATSTTHHYTHSGLASIWKGTMPREQSQLEQ